MRVQSPKRTKKTKTIDKGKLGVTRGRKASGPVYPNGDNGIAGLPKGQGAGLCYKSEWLRPINFRTLRYIRSPLFGGHSLNKNASLLFVFSISLERKNNYEKTNPLLKLSFSA